MKVNSIKINLNQGVIEQLNEAKDRAMDLTTQAILSDIVTRGVVPKDTGQLEHGSGAFKSGYTERVKECVYAIIYNTPYARRWYYNLPFTDKNGIRHAPVTFKRDTAIDHWMDYYISNAEGIQWVQTTYAKFFKQESGGIVR